MKTSAAERPKTVAEALTDYRFRTIPEVAAILGKPQSGIAEELTELCEAGVAKAGRMHVGAIDTVPCYILVAERLFQ